MKHVAKSVRRRPECAPGRRQAKRCLDHIVATRAPGAKPFRGRLQAGQLVLPCAIGAAGVRRDKREGDHASPAGRWRVVCGYYRADKMPPPPGPLAMRRIRRNDCWCDDPESPLYNRPAPLPFGRSHEALWRADDLYDIVIVLDYNFSPRRKRRGSAIFLHCARADFAPTEGCIALRRADLRRLLPRLGRGAVLTIR